MYNLDGNLWLYKSTKSIYEDACFYKHCKVPKKDSFEYKKIIKSFLDSGKINKYGVPIYTHNILIKEHKKSLKLLKKFFDMKPIICELDKNFIIGAKLKTFKFTKKYSNKELSVFCNNIKKILSDTFLYMISLDKNYIQLKIAYDDILDETQNF